MNVQSLYNQLTNILKQYPQVAEFKVVTEGCDCLGFDTGVSVETINKALMIVRDDPAPDAYAIDIPHK